MFTETMTEKVKELRELKRMAEELAAEISSIEDEIKAVLSANELETLSGADWKITWKVVTSNRLDTTALKKALPDVAAQFTKQASYRRFVLA